ncbi:hypothetical protein ACFFIX_19455 [Metabacillus herbersteinensis]|uniref:Uncharacterized protein n=1 Tax=Metabacillus herbersteinensis TaxID=283816 RepID=A0ABV6GIQ1_9BACI
MKRYVLIDANTTEVTKKEQFIIKGSIYRVQDVAKATLFNEEDANMYTSYNKNLIIKLAFDIHYDLEKMKKFVDKDGFLKFMVNDLTKSLGNAENAYEVVFNSEVFSNRRRI